MMKKVEWILAVFLFLSFSAPSFAEETIRITNAEWAPYTSERLKYNGVASRVASEAFALMGVKVIYEFYPEARAYDLAKKGEWDASIAWSIFPEREKDFWGADPVFEGYNVFFHLKSKPFDWKTVDDLKGIPIGATLAFAYSKWFKPAEESGKIMVERVGSDEINFRKLLQHRIDIFPVNLEVGYFTLKLYFSPEEVAQVTHHPLGLNDKSGYGVIFSKSVKRNEQLVPLFNEGLKKLKVSGKYDQYFEESRRGDYILKK